MIRLSPFTFRLGLMVKILGLLAKVLGFSVKILDDLAKILAVFVKILRKTTSDSCIDSLILLISF